MSEPIEDARELTHHEITLLLGLAVDRETARVYTERARKKADQLAAALDEYRHGLIDGNPVVTVTRSRPERFDLARFRKENELLARAYVKVGDETVTVLPAKAARDAATAKLIPES